MELTGVAALRRSLASASLAVVPRERRRRMPYRVSCVGRGGGTSFADEAHLRYYEAAPRKAVEAAARDLSKLRAMGLVAGDAAKEKILSEATELLFQELSQMKDAEDELKKKQKEEKAAMKALKKQQKEAKKAAMECGDGSSESSESECEEDQSMAMSCVGTSLMPGIEQRMAMSMSVPQVGAVPAMDFDKAAMKPMKKREKEQKKAAKKALKMKKDEEKMMATMNSCKDEDSSSCSSESSESECEGKVLRMSRCATITAPPASTVFPIIVPQIPDSVAPNAQISPGPATAVQYSTTSSIALVEIPPNRVEVCMGGILSTYIFNGADSESRQVCPERETRSKRRPAKAGRRDWAGAATSEGWPQIQATPAEAREVKECGHIPAEAREVKESDLILLFQSPQSADQGQEVEYSKYATSNTCMDRCRRTLSVGLL